LLSVSHIFFYIFLSLNLIFHLLLQIFPRLSKNYFQLFLNYLFSNNFSQKENNNDLKETFSFSFTPNSFLSCLISISKIHPKTLNPNLSFSNNSAIQNNNSMLKNMHSLSQNHYYQLSHQNKY
jgi:hypothetical protein